MSEEIKEDEKATVTIEFNGPQSDADVRRLTATLEAVAKALGFTIARRTTKDKR